MAGLIVDTSLLYSADPDGAVEGSTSALLLAEIIIKRRYTVILPDALEGEWHRRMSSWAMEWYADIESRRRIVRRCVPVLDGRVEHRLNRLVNYEFDGKAMQHEFKLIQAAASTDSPILSFDEKARCFFSRAARCEASIDHVVWLNPLEFDFIQWLAGGAQPRNADRLPAHFCRRNHNPNCPMGIY